MRKKTSLFKFIQLWIVISLVAVGGSIIVLEIIVSYRDFQDQAEKLRADYINQQKEMIKLEVNRVVALINHTKAQSEVITKENIKCRVYEAYAIAQHIYQQNKAAKSKAEIKQMILDALRPVRFAEGNGYYFATRLDGVEMLFADKPELEGLNLLDVQDTHGQYIIKETIDTVRQHGEGFQEYYWTKPGAEGRDFKKISYVKLFEPFDWFIGTGLYVDDIEAANKEQLMRQINEMRFGVNGYFFVDDWQGISLAHGIQPELIGTNMWETEDSQGNKTTQMLVAAAQQKEGGYVSYWWRKSPLGKESPKIAYARGVPDWEILVGSGVYLDDIEPDIAVMYTKLTKQIRKKMFLFALIVIAVIALILFTVKRLNHRLKNDFNIFLSFFNRAAYSDETINRDQVQFIELDMLAENANKMLLDKIISQKNLLNKKEELLQSEAKYKTFIEDAPDLRYQVDVEGKIVFVSQSVGKFTGYTAKEAIGKNITDLYASPGDRVLLLETLQKDGYVDNFEVQLKRKDNSLWWGSVNAQLYKNQAGTVLGIDSAIRDVSEQKLVQSLLAQSEQRLQMAVEGADLGMWDWDLQTDNVYFNPRYLTMLGYGPTELPHTFATWKNLLHPDERELFCQQALAYIEKRQGRWSNEFRLRTKDGRYKWILAQGKIVEFSSDGLPLRAVGTHLDITNRKLAEEELRDREERFRELFNNMSSGVAIYEAVEEGENFVFKDLNRAGLLSSQVNLCEIVGKKVTEIFPNIKDMGLFDVFQRVYKTGTPEHFPTSLYQDDRVTLWVDNYVCKIPSGEIITVYDDVTDRKKADEELIKIRKLESVGVLAGGIAHDFNNILAAILGNISLALTTVDQKDEIYELLAESEKASLRAKDLTQQLLTFAKGGEPVKKIAAISEVIKDSAGFVLRGSNVRCDFKFDEELWPVAIDTGQISQVIQNIVVNANQAMPTGGTITIEGSNYCMESSAIMPLSSGNYIKIVVKDQGVGIPADMLDKVFDPYFTTKQKGSGLGLAITNSIVNKHDGYITVDSKPGQGTTFTIYLPASQDRPELETEAIVGSPETGQGRVMIMDDEEMVRKLVHRILSRRGYEVVSAEDGRQAIQLYQEAVTRGRPIDLIIMDLTIPGGMGGKEAVEEIHRIDPQAKVIVSSGYSNDPVMANFSKYGFDTALAKPFKMKELLEVAGKATAS